MKENLKALQIILSTLMVSALTCGAVLITYKFINLSLYSPFWLNIIYAAVWFVVMFFVSFAIMSINVKINIKPLALIHTIILAISFVFVVLYPWFIGQYTPLSIILRLVWGYMNIGMAVWCGLMIIMQRDC